MVAIRSPTNNLVTHVVLGPTTVGECLPNGAFGDTLQVVSRHFGGDEGKEGQDCEAEDKTGDQSDHRVQISHPHTLPSIFERPTRCSAAACRMTFADG